MPSLHVSQVLINIYHLEPEVLNASLFVAIQHKNAKLGQSCDLIHKANIQWGLVMIRLENKYKSHDQMYCNNFP